MRYFSILKCVVFSSQYRDVLNELSVFKTEMEELNYQPEVIPEATPQKQESKKPEIKKVEPQKLETKGNQKLQEMREKFDLKKPLSEWASTKPNVKEEVVQQPQLKKFKFEPVEANTSKSQPKPQRHGFNAPKKNPVFYGDDNDDDDFQ